jgi:hypothetical protein
MSDESFRMNVGGGHPATRTDGSDAPPAEFSIGSRCQVKMGGKFSRRLQGRTGTVVGSSQSKNGIRVVLDGAKTAQTLHRSYLIPLMTAGPSLQGSFDEDPTGHD